MKLRSKKFFCPRLSTVKSLVVILGIITYRMLFIFWDAYNSIFYRVEDKRLFSCRKFRIKLLITELTDSEIFIDRASESRDE